MTRITAHITGALLLFVAVALHAQERPQFRARVDLVEVDVVVIDGSGRIVRGLTKEDFELREGGKAAEIKTFVPVASDNAARDEEGRLVVLFWRTSIGSGTREPKLET